MTVKRPEYVTDTKWEKWELLAFCITAFAGLLGMLPWFFILKYTTR